MVHSRVFEYRFFTASDPSLHKPITIPVTCHLDKTPPQCYTVNIDGSFIAGSNKGGIGCVVCNSEGIWIVGFMGAALLKGQGLEILDTFALQPVEIETDSLDLFKYTGKCPTIA